jgi:hypothetical protein
MKPNSPVPETEGSGFPCFEQEFPALVCLCAKTFVLQKGLFQHEIRCKGGGNLASSLPKIEPCADASMHGNLENLILYFLHS